MVGVLLNCNYKYENAVLDSGAKVSASEVTIKDGKVDRINNGSVTVSEGTFSFSIYNYGPDGKKTYNLSNVPENVDGQDVVKEFVEFVEEDVLS